jgi:hypothetical protein
MFHKGFFLDAAFAYSADFYRFDFDYQGLMDIRNADILQYSADILNAWTLRTLIQMYLLMLLI